VFSLPSGYLAITGETIQASQHNPPLEDLESAMSARLMRSGVAPMTGPLKITDGSVGSPGLKFNTDGTTGFYKTTDGIGVSVGGTKVAEFTSNGIRKDARWIGELIPFSGLTAPELTVLPYGQTLSRTTYADLWAFAQTEIAAGNSFYNNGNGTTTFGVGDLRGRVIAGKDDMGGSAASRLTTAATGFTTTTLGAAGGAETITLTTAQIPSHSHANTLNDPGHAHTTTASSGNAGLNAGIGGTTVAGPVSTSSTIASTTGISINNASAGSGNAHGNVQPTMICNYILYAGA
jgi:microcystin-dependent protein